MSSAMVLAMVLAMPVGRAWSAGFNGTGTLVSGSLFGSPGDVVNMQSSTAVIDWTTNGTPSGGAYDFLSAGGTQSFFGPSGFTVLNRVLPTDGVSAIALNGIISGTNGNVWIYSPNSILVGSTAVFNVGGLLLTTLDPVRDANGALTSGTTFSLGSAQSPTNGASSITIAPGAMINAQQTGSYVALVSPVVNQGGVVTVNGTAAYIAAEQVDVSINQGLFDITFQQGTTSAAPITHSGTTTGTASTGGADLRRIYLAAVPKNQAMTMLLSGGSLGFDVAGAADVQGNTIVLSAGKNITNPGGVMVATDYALSGNAQADVAVDGGTFTSALTTFAKGNTTIAPAAGTLSLPGLRAEGNGSITVGATAANSILNIAGNLDISTSIYGAPGESVMASNAKLTVDGGGVVNVGGYLNMQANASGRINNSGSTIQMTGGQLTIDAVSGTIHVAGSTTLDAVASGDSSGTNPTRVVAGDIAIIGGGTVNLDQGLQISSVADGTFGDSSAPGDPGYAYGGSVTIANATLNVGGFGVGIDALAYAASTNGVGIAGGEARTATVQVRPSGTANLAALSISAQADAGSSANGDGGAATVNTIGVGADGSSAHLTVGNSITVMAAANGGNADSGVGVGGAARLNGDITIFAQGAGAQLDADAIVTLVGLTGGRGAISGGAATAGLLGVNALSGGTLNTGSVTLSELVSAGGANGGSAGLVTGNVVGLFADGGTLTASGDVDLIQNVSVNGDPSPVSGSLVTAGTVQILGHGASTITVAGATSLTANATSFNNFSQGGAARGGVVYIASTDAGGVINLGTNPDANSRSVTLSATGHGGDGNYGGDGLGGRITVGGGSGTVDIKTALQMDVTGTGGAGDFSGSGGVGKGGIAVLRTELSGGQTLVGEGAVLIANGFGGAGGYNGTGGEGRGGTAAVNATNGTILINNASGAAGYLVLNADGQGGGGNYGGAGYGGTLNGGVYEGGAFANATNGTLTLHDGTSGQYVGLVMTANGTGGDGQATSGDGDGGTGGLGRAGYAELAALSGAGDSFVHVDTVTLTANGTGGIGGSGLSFNGGAGGMGLGGGATPNDVDDGLGTGGIGLFAQATNGHLTVTGNVTLAVIGQGGAGGTSSSANGGDGGVGKGGGINAGLVSGPPSGVTTGTADFFGDILFNATGQGGNGEAGGSSAGAGGNGGLGEGGGAFFLARGGVVNGAVSTPGLLNFELRGRGGDGGSSQVAQGGVGGDAIGGSLAVRSTYRFNTTTAGNLKVGDISGDVSAFAGVGGSDAPDGVTTAGDFAIAASHSAFVADSILISATGGAGPTPRTGELSAIGATLKVNNDIYIGADNNVALFTDQGGIIETGSLTIGANAVVDSASSTPVTAPGIVRILGSTPSFYVQHFNNQSTFEAPNFNLNTNGGPILIGGVSTPGLVSLQSDTGIAVLRDIVSGTSVSLTSSNGPIMAGNITSSDGIAISSGTDASLGILNTANYISAFVGGNLHLAGATAGRDAALPPPSFPYPKTINLMAGGSITATGPVSAVDYVLMGAGNGSITTADITSDDSIGLFATGNVSTGAITAIGGEGGSGGLYIGNYSQVSQASGSGPGAMFGTPPARIGGTISTGSIVGNNVVMAAQTGITVGDLAPALLTLDSGGFLTTGAITVADSLLLTAAGPITTGQLTSDRFISVSGSGTVSVGGATAAEDIEISGGGAISTGVLTAGTTIDVDGAANVTIASASAGRGSVPAAPTDSGISVRSGGLLTVSGLATTSGNIGLFSTGSIATGALTTDSNVIALAAQNVSLGTTTTASTGQVYIANASMFPILNQAQDPAALFVLQPAWVAGTVTLGSVTTGILNAAAIGGISAAAPSGGAAGQPSITTTGDLLLTTEGGLTAGTLTAGQRLLLNGNTITAGQLTAGGELAVEAHGNVVTGALVSGHSISADSDIGSVSVASASAGIVTKSNASDASYKVGIGAGTSVSVGTVNALGDIGMKAEAGTITAGNVTTQGSYAAVSSNGTTLASVTTGATGTLYLADASMASLADADKGFNLAPLLAATPVRSAGAIVIGGAVSTGTLVAASNGFTAQGALTAANAVNVSSGAGAAFNAAVTAPTISITSVGLTAQALTAANSIVVNSSAAATFNGAAVAPTIAVTSPDIIIGGQGSIGGANTTALTLTSTATQTTLGGTAGLTGYQLDGSEISKLRATQIAFVAPGDIAMQALTVNAGTQLGATGGFRVQTPGSIRVTGAVDFSNVAAGNSASFVAGRSFTIVTDTGRLRMLGANNAVAGIASITATDIAVVNNSIATQLAANPRFNGRDLLLAAAQTGNAVNADGYLQAGRLNFTASNTLLIQNSGTLSSPAGFTAGVGGINIISTGTAANPLDVAIYGRGVDSAGVALASTAVKGAIAVSPANSLSSTSSANGCLFSATSCDSTSGTQEIAQAQVSNISATIQSVVTGGLGIPGGVGAADQGTQSASNDDGGDDSDEAAAAPSSSPVGTNVLIDTGNLGNNVAQPDAMITSSGNSSLWSGADGISGDGFGSSELGTPATGGTNATTGNPADGDAGAVGGVGDGNASGGASGGGGTTDGSAAPGTAGAPPNGPNGSSDEPKKGGGR